VRSVKILEQKGVEEGLFADPEKNERYSKDKGGVHWVWRGRGGPPQDTGCFFLPLRGGDRKNSNGQGVRTKGGAKKTKK